MREWKSSKEKSILLTLTFSSFHRRHFMNRISDELKVKCTFTLSLSRRVELTFTKTHYTTETRRDKIIPTAHLHGKLIRLHTKVPLFLPCLCCFLEQQNSKSFRNFESHVGERRKDSKYLTKILQKLILLFQLSRVLHSSSLASSSFNTNPFSVRKRIEAQKITNSESWRTSTLGLDMFLRQARVFFVSILWVDLRRSSPWLPKAAVKESQWVNMISKLTSERESETSEQFSDEILQMWKLEKFTRFVGWRFESADVENDE